MRWRSIFACWPSRPPRGSRYIQSGKTCTWNWTRARIWTLCWTPWTRRWRKRSASEQKQTRLQTIPCAIFFYYGFKLLEDSFLVSFVHSLHFTSHYVFNWYCLRSRHCSLHFGTITIHKCWQVTGGIIYNKQVHASNGVSYCLCTSGTLVIHCLESHTSLLCSKKTKETWRKVPEIAQWGHKTGIVTCVASLWSRDNANMVNGLHSYCTNPNHIRYRTFSGDFDPFREALNH